MPYRKIKNNDGSYRVINSATGEVHMKSGTESDADAQIRLLHGVDNGMVPRKRRSYGRKLCLN